MRRKPLRVLGVLFLIIGIALLLGAVFVRLSSDKFFKSAIETEATIDRIESYTVHNHKGYKRNRRRKEHVVYISYMTEDGEYYSEQEFGYYTSNMYEGQNIKVYYDPENPEDVRSKSGSKLVFYICGGIGGLFSVLGLIFVCVKTGEHTPNMQNYF